MRACGVRIGISRMRLKSVKPLLPPKPVSLRKNRSIAAYVIACVMIEKYTPLMRERKAKKPNTKATIAGTAPTRNSFARFAGLDRHAEDALEVGEAVVAAEAGLVAEEQKHRGNN